jgi:adenosyl cobinamide kinase/adenosyl cobinamide phosphate guanylyltransferase
MKDHASPPIILILGGIKTGKTTFAQNRAKENEVSREFSNYLFGHC